jgi:hypothetical protein
MCSMNPITMALLLLLCSPPTAGGQQLNKDDPPPLRVSSLSPSPSPPALTKGVYGSIDNRLDESDPAIPVVIATVGSQSTVALVPKTKLIYHASTNTWGAAASVTTLQAGFNLCTQDNGTAAPFKDQLVPSDCSGTVVHWNVATGIGLVATAGHCLDADDSTSGCQNAAGGLAAPPPYGSPADLATVPADECKYYFVFDFTDDKQNSTTLSIPGANVYDCAKIVTCDVQKRSWTAGKSFQDFALAEITQAGGSVVTEVATCRSDWEDDGTCDVPRNCPLGTDLVDCNTVDSPAAVAARTTNYTMPPRAILGIRPGIAPPVLNAEIQAVGSALTVIGHPSGLPRKYTGGATISSVFSCTGKPYTCPSSALTGGSSFSGYVADLDTFAGNSGSGTFNAAGEMIGILISGGTDYRKALDRASGCQERAICPEGIVSSFCWHYDTTVTKPAACASDASSAACISACGTVAAPVAGMSVQSCAGENIVGIGSLMESLVAAGAPAPTGYGSVPTMACCDADGTCFDKDEAWCCLGAPSPAGSNGNSMCPVCTCPNGTSTTGAGVQIATVTTCPSQWEGDGTCDVPVDCPLGTDLVDCAADSSTTTDDSDTDAYRAARTILTTVTGSNCMASGIDCSACDPGYTMSSLAGTGSQTCVGVTPTLTPTPTPTPTPIAVSMTLPGDVAALTSNATIQAAFEIAFATDIAQILGIAASRITAISIAAGSVVVTYTIAPAANGTQLAKSAVTTAFSSPVSFNNIKASVVIPSSITAQYAQAVQANVVVTDSTKESRPTITKSNDAAQRYRATTLATTLLMVTATMIILN